MPLNELQLANLRQHSHSTDQVIDPETGEPISGGGGGAVDSVNGQTGVVVLAAADVGAIDQTTLDDALAALDFPAPVIEQFVTNVATNETFVTELVNNDTYVTNLVTEIFEGDAADTYVTQLTENNTFITNNTTQINANINGKKGVANELATLDGSGKLTASQIPSSLATDAEVAAGYQPLDSDLTAFAALAIAADKLPYGSGSHAMSLADFTAYARTLLALSSKAAVQSELGISGGPSAAPLAMVYLATVAR